MVNKWKEIKKLKNKNQKINYNEKTFKDRGSGFVVVQCWVC